jgi:hypothetical protein
MDGKKGALFEAWPFIAAGACLIVEMAVAAAFSSHPLGVFLAPILLLFCIVLPGSNLRRALGISTAIPAFDAAISIGLGLALAPLVFSAWTAVGLQGGALIVLAVIGYPALARFRKGLPGRQALAELPWMAVLAAGVCLIAFVPAYRMSDGAMIPSAGSWIDFQYNAALVTAVADSFPPFNTLVGPGLLNYHVGYPDLLALLGFGSRANPFDVVMRFAPVWIWIIGLFMCYGAALGFGLSRVQARLTSVLIMLGGGLFAIPAALATSVDLPVSLLAFKLITTGNLMCNATLVAVPLTLVALAVVGRSLSTRQSGLTLAAIWLVFTCCLYKSFFHPVVISGWLAALVAIRLRKGRAPFLPWLISAALSAPVWYWYMLANARGAGTRITLDAGYLRVIAALPFEWASKLVHTFDSGSIIAAGFIAFLVSVGFLAWGMGIGLAGVRNWWRDLWAKDDLLRTPLAWAVAAGCCATMILYDRPHHHVTTEWFFICAQFCMVVFAVPVVARLMRSKTAAIIVAVALFFGTAQALYHFGDLHWNGDRPISAEKVTAAFDLSRKITPRDLVAVGPDENLGLAVLTGGSIYAHSTTKTMIERYLGPEMAAQRELSYDELYETAVVPTDLPSDRSLWVGLDRSQFEKMFADTANCGTVGAGQWLWICFGSPAP